MKPNLKVNMLFRDRVGIVSDISGLLVRHGLNIVSMEVQRRETRADVYFEIESDDPAPQKNAVLDTLGTVPDLIEMHFIETLPQETRENRFKVVLDNIRDGVISIDAEGRITTMNRVSRRALDLEGAELTGRDVKELGFSDLAILECLKGREYNNVKRDIITGRGRFQYFVTGRPIRDSAGRIVGAVEIGRDMREIRLLARSLSQPARITFSDIIGEHPTMKDLLAYAQRIALTDSVVLIRGESGTGKELFAQAIHQASGRSGPFLPVNCAGIPEPLLESELFGYVGGAFTGARKEGKAGLFEAAGGGSIFLDEIGEMPPGVQAKLLRVIQEQTVRRVGDSKEIPIETRIITATNQNLEKMVQEGRFREDLYYRVNVLPIHIPPLRERLGDMPLLVNHFLFQLGSRLEKKPQTLTDEAMAKLRTHRWPGNIREMRNVIERAAILCDSERIDAEYILFHFDIGERAWEAPRADEPAGTEPRPLRTLVEEFEKRVLSEATSGRESMRAVARRLGISHTALMNKVRRYGLERDRQGEGVASRR